MSDIVIPALQDFLYTLITGVLGVLSAFLIALAKKAFDWVSEKINALKDERAQKAFAQALENLRILVDATVTSLQQTIGDEIKKSIEAADGKYTYEDLLALKDKALFSVKAQLTDSAKKALSSVYSDLDSFIIDLIETRVREMKSEFLPKVAASSRVLLG